MSCNSGGDIEGEQLLMPFIIGKKGNLSMMTRLNLVKNTNFGMDNFFLYFGSRNNFVLNELFEKMPFSAQKMHFIDKNGNLTHWPARASFDVKEFFLDGNFKPILEAKKVGTAGQKCPGHFDSSQFSPKSAIFGGFEKKSF